MAAKSRKQTWGGARPGAGRPKGSGKGPSADARTNRIAVMLNQAELEKLTLLATRRRVPLATLAYEFIAGALRRAR